MVLDFKNSWDSIFAFTIFALRATLQNTMQYTTDQLVFGRDSIIYQRHDVDWEIIMRRKQNLINQGNKYENHNQIEHTYKQEDKNLLKNG